MLQFDYLAPQVDQLSRRARRDFWRDRHNLARRDILARRWQGFYSGFGNVPGIGSTVETYEAAPTWARHSLLVWAPGMISSAAIDSGNTPTTTLRPGLVLGKITASALWTNYSPTATDGSQVAQGVLGIGLPMLDPFTNAVNAKQWGIIVGGPLQTGKLLGLDLQAQAAMSARFIFDTNTTGNGRFPAQNFVTKTANYQVLATDNLASFDNEGAAGPVTFTLPPILNGYSFNFRGRAAQNLIVASSEGANMEALNNLVANSVAFQTGSQIVGGEFQVFSTPDLKWIVRNLSAGTNTVTVA